MQLPIDHLFETQITNPASFIVWRWKLSRFYGILSRVKLISSLEGPARMSEEVPHYTISCEFSAVFDFILIYNFINF